MYGLEPGPAFKPLLDAVREAQLEGSIITAEQAMGLVDRLLAEGFTKDYNHEKEENPTGGNKER